MRFLGEVFQKAQLLKNDHDVTKPEVSLLNSNTVILYGGQIFPTGLQGAAGSKRIVNIAKIINRSGHRVLLLAISKSNSSKGRIDDEIEYISIEKKAGFIHRINPFHAGNDYVNALKKINTHERIDRIFLAGVFSNAIVPVISFAKRYDIELDLIANDRYERSSQTFLQHLNTEFAWRILYKKCKKVIATSRYFSDYFKSMGAEVLLIPCVFDAPEFSLIEHNKSKQKIVIGYAGDLKNRKDYTDNAIRALDLVDENIKDKFLFMLAGVDRKDLIKNLANEDYLLDKYDKNIVFYPFLKGSEYKDFLQKADYTILVRPDLLYARAGFATKFGDSMINGIPVIANHVGDVQIYLKDEVNGFVVEDETAEAIAKTLNRITLVSSNRYERMRKDTYKFAENVFSVSSYYKAMGEFLAQS